MVVGGKAIGAMLRTAKRGQFKANYSAGGSVKPLKLNPKLEWLATESAKVLGLDIAGVDVFYDGNGYQVGEVNSSADFDGFEKSTKVNVAKEVFNYIKVRLGKAK